MGKAESSFSFPISLSMFKVHFLTAGIGGASSEVFPALPFPFPFLIFLSQLCSCRWWLERSCSYALKS